MFDINGQLYWPVAPPNPELHPFWTPEFVGDISGHLTGHRGRIMGNQTASASQVTISAEMPEAELLDYQTRLKSLTGGKGVYSAGFDHYAPAPPAVQKSLVEAFRPRSED